jgi:gliding motility-associated-like protein
VDSTLCPGETAILNGPNGFSTYSWSPNGETTQSITVSQPGTYCVTVSVGGNCASNQLCGTVKINPAPNAEFSFLPESPMILEQMPVCFTNMSTIDSGSIVSYAWLFGDTIPGTDNVMNPCYSYTYRDSFCIRMIATSNFGCTDTVVHCLEVVPDSLFIPNVFTPNSDLYNDVFHFPNIGYINLHCDIYNRWGNHIYSWDGVKGGWDGDTKSGPASDGTYYYVMWAERIDNRITKSHGFLTLLRNK